MSEVVRIGCIKYLNSLPMFHDFEGRSFEDSLNDNPGGIRYRVISETPAVLNEMMKKGELDISTVSSFHYLENRRDLQMMNRFCIAASGKVMSVLIVSKRQLAELSGQTVLLTDESASGAALARIMLCEFFGNTSINFRQAKIDGAGVREAMANENAAAALLIGDEALRYYRDNRNAASGDLKHYDLAELWNRLTSLPFIFGVMAARKDFFFGNKAACDAISAAITSRVKYFRDRRESFIACASERSGFEPDIVREYFECLSYEFMPDYIMALEEFEKRFQKISAPAAAGRR